jgi:hypothetical protein
MTTKLNTNQSTHTQSGTNYNLATYLQGYVTIHTDTVATLKAMDLQPGQVVRTNAYSDILQGGGATYLIKAPEAVDGYGSHVLDNGNVAVIRAQDGEVNILQYGLVADGAAGAATGTDNSAAFQALVANTSIRRVTGAKGVFYFGTLGLDEELAVRTTKPIDIDWGGAYLTVNGDNTITNTGMKFLKLQDVRGSMSNFEFEDINFDVATSTGRGVQPINIYNTTANTEGYTIGPCVIHKGQSLVTAFSDNPNNFKASDIRLGGACDCGNVYYGVNLSNNGDSFSGKFSCDVVNRAVFVYGITDCDIDTYVSAGDPSSAHVLISNSGASSPITENVRVRAHFGTIEGPMVIADQTQTGDPADGRYKNIDLTVIIDSVGTNIAVSDAIVRLGAFALAGGYVASGTLSMDEVKIDLQSALDLTNPIQIETQSPNYRIMRLSPGTYLNDYGLASNAVWIQGGLVSKMASGDLTTQTVAIDARIFGSSPKNGSIRARVIVSAVNGFAQTQQSIAEYHVIGKLSSGGVFTLQQATLLDQTSIGTAPAFTLSASGSDLTVDTTNYTDSNALMRVSAERL